MLTVWGDIDGGGSVGTTVTLPNAYDGTSPVRCFAVGDIPFYNPSNSTLREALVNGAFLADVSTSGIASD